MLLSKLSFAVFHSNWTVSLLSSVAVMLVNIQSFEYHLLSSSVSGLYVMLGMSVSVVSV